MSKSYSTGTILGLENDQEIKENKENQTSLSNLSIDSQQKQQTKQASLTMLNNQSPDLSSAFIKPKIKSQSFEVSLILMHKYLKEKYSNSNPETMPYKYRTVYLARNSFGTSYNPYGSEFGFNLQTYGLLNSLTKQTEYLCFINNVQPKSSAKRAGLNNGDILLSIDTMRLDQFRSFPDIVKHVKGKNELYLVVLPERICKRIQYEQRVEQIRKLIEEKQSELVNFQNQEEILMKKYNIPTNNNNPITPNMESSLTSSHSFSSSSESGSLSAKSAQTVSSSVQTPTNNDDSAVFLSPIQSTSENMTDSTNSNTSSYSTVSTHNNNSQVVKNSTPLMMDLTTDSAYLTEKTTTSDSDTSSSFERRNSSSTNGSYIVKLVVKSNDLSSQKPSNNKSHSKSIAKKCIEKTNRLIRSASTSSMNLLNKLNGSFSSSSTSINNGQDKKSTNNMDNKSSKPQSAAALSASSQSIEIKNQLVKKPDISGMSQSHTFDNFQSVLLTNSDADNSTKPSDALSNKENNLPIIIKNSETTINRVKPSYSSSRVIKLNYEPNGFIKKRGLFNKLNNSAHVFDTTKQPKQSSFPKDSDKTDQLLFNILTNKPKLMNKSLDEKKLVHSSQDIINGTSTEPLSNSLNDATYQKMFDLDSVARIRSNGGLKSDENYADIASVKIVIDENNNTNGLLSNEEDFVITRL